jgi:hypothetical protein
MRQACPPRQQPSDLGGAHEDKGGPACTGLGCMQGLTVRRTQLGWLPARGIGLG